MSINYIFIGILGNNDITWAGVQGREQSVIRNGHKSFNSNAWQDLKVVVPAIVSGIAIVLTITTICACVRKRKNFHSFYTS